MIKKLPIAPSSDRPYSFNDEADKFVAALQPMCDDINEALSHIDDVKTSIDNSEASFIAKYDDFSPKYDEFVLNYAKFSPKYDEFIAKYDDFIPKYDKAIALEAFFKTSETQINSLLEEAKSYINTKNRLINDSITSKTTTYSSSKIEEKFNDQVKNNLSFLYDEIIFNKLDFILYKLSSLSSGVGNLTFSKEERTFSHYGIFDEFDNYVLFQKTNKSLITQSNLRFIFNNTTLNQINTGEKNDTK